MLYHIFENMIFADLGDSTLPIDGWYHNCILCYTITSNLKNYKYNSVNYELFICPKCNKKSIPSKIINIINNIISKDQDNL